MSDEKSSGRKLVINEITLWRTGTVIFAILFIIALFTGGFSGSDKVGELQEAPTKGLPSAAPSAAPQAPAEPVDIEIGDAYFKGDKKAKVTIIEFSEFQCPYCGRFVTQTMPQIMEEYVDKGKVKLAFKHLPLGFHDKAQKAAEATECAGKIGGDDMFWGMHDKLFEDQQAIGVDNLKKYAGELGLDQGEFDSCLDNGDTADKVSAHKAEAAKVGASGTPTFFINGNKLVGAQPFEAFKAAIDAEL